MKYAKAHPKLLYGFGFGVLIVSFLLVEFATSAIINAYYAHWAVLATVLILCCSRFTNQKLIANTSEKPRLTVWPWLGRIALLQISLFFIFIGMSLVFSHWLPVMASSQSNVVNQTLTILLKQDGLLPWGIYALYAAALGYISYIKNQDAHAGDLILPVFHKKPNSLFSNAVNLQARSATFIVLSITFALITLLITALIMPRSVPLYTGFHIKTLIIIFALVLLGFTPPFKKVVKKLLHPKIPLFITTATTLVLFALLIWILNAFFGEIGVTTVKSSAFILWLQRKNPITLWIIFSAAWWIGWTPLIAAHIAKLSRGYRIRYMMLGTLLLPLIFTLSFITFPTGLNIFSNTPVITSLLSIVAFIYLLKQLTEKTALPLMIRSYLPKRDTYKRRDHYFYFRKLFQIMLVVIYLYLPAGLSITVFVAFTMTLSFMLQIPFCLTVFLRMEIKRSY